MEELATLHPEIDVLVKQYRQNLDPEMNMVYTARNRFDQSVSNLNREFSHYLEQQQIKAQAHFPHYFDKNTTDGIEFGAYTGPSMQPDGRWSPLYLQNLRLWHLVVLVANDWIARSMKDRLPIALDVTHLAVVQYIPLSIHFSTDAHQFEVEGAYNIRYEILKKRIDKAKIKDSSERITKAGYLTVVYSHTDEEIEYKNYLKFLIAKNLLVNALEELEVEDLQGLKGLKAFRLPIQTEVRPSLIDMDVNEMASAYRESGI
jgi:hypothetical protein